jgi:hypothetical protein
MLRSLKSPQGDTPLSRERKRKFTSSLSFGIRIGHVFFGRVIIQWSTCPGNESISTDYIKSGLGLFLYAEEDRDWFPDWIF